MAAPRPHPNALIWLLLSALVIALDQWTKLLALGFAGLILPALPGIPLVYAGLVLLAWAEDFAYVGWVTLGVLDAMAADGDSGRRTSPGDAR